MDDIFDLLGEVRRRGMEPIRQPLRRNLLRTALKADRLLVEDRLPVGHLFPDSLNSETG